MNGSETIDIGKQDVKALRGTPAEQYIDKSGEKLTVPYGKISDVSFKMVVDPGSSKAEDDVDQLAKLKELNDEINANPLVTSWFLGQDGKKLNSGELLRQRIQRMGLKNLDMILTDMSPEEAQQAAQAPFPIVDKPQFRINSQDLSPAAMIEVLKLGGVNVDPQQGGAPSAQAQLDAQIEMQKLQATAQAQAPQENQGMSTEELAMKHTEFDQKQQDLDRKEAELQFKAQQHETDTILKADKQAHDTQLALASHVQGAQQAQLSHELAAESAKQSAQTAKKKPAGAAA
jgi:hypothetical protein